MQSLPLAEREMQDHECRPQMESRKSSEIASQEGQLTDGADSPTLHFIPLLHVKVMHGAALVCATHFKQSSSTSTFQSV